MLEIGFNSSGELSLAGRLDASQADLARRFFDDVSGPTVVDMAGLEYISSAGLGVLLATQQRLVSESGQGLKLVRLSKHVSDVFRIAGFDQVLDIEYS